MAPWARTLPLRLSFSKHTKTLLPKMSPPPRPTLVVPVLAGDQGGYGFLTPPCKEPLNEPPPVRKVNSAEPMELQFDMDDMDDMEL